MNRIFIISAILFLSGLMSATPAFSSDANKFLLFGETYESHSDKEMPDNFMQSLLTYSRGISHNVTRNIFYVHKYDLQTNNTGNQTLGITYTKQYPKNFSMQAGYSYNWYYKETGRSSEFEDGKVKLGAYKKYDIKGGRGNTVCSIVYNADSDWSQNEVVSAGVDRNINYDKNTLIQLGYHFVYGLSGVDQHLYDSWSVNYIRKLSYNRSLFVGYMYIDKRYNYGNVGIYPYDDEILRLGMIYDIRSTALTR